MKNSINTAIEIRRCGYDPTGDMIPIKYNEMGESEELYLEVKYRVLWFNRYCMDNGIDGLIGKPEIEYHDSMNLVQATVSIYMDGKLVASDAASDVYIPGDNEHNSKIIQRICTAAKGRALANAGFGTISAAVPSEAGEFFPVDAGVACVRDANNPLVFRKVVSQPAIPVPTIPAPAAPVQTTVQNAAPVNTYPAVPDRCPPEATSTGIPAPAANTQSMHTVPAAPKPARKASQPVPVQQTVKQPSATMTLQEAFNVLVPVGAFKGRTISQLMAEKPRNAKWFLSDEFSSKDKYPQFIDALTMVIQSVEA